MTNLPAPPEPKIPTTAGAQLFVWFLIIAFVLVFVIVGANTLIGP